MRRGEGGKEGRGEHPTANIESPTSRRRWFVGEVLSEVVCE